MTAPTTTQTDDHLTLKDAAARLGLNPVTLKRKANTNQLPAYRDGAGRWLFRTADLDTFAAEYLTPKPYVPTAD